MGMHNLAWYKLCFEIAIDLANLFGSAKSPLLASDMQTLG